MSHVVPYYERLNDTTVEVTLPDTQGQAFEIYRDLEAMATSDPKSWKAAVRLWTASDLYIMGLFMSWWWRKDGWTGRAEVDCDFQFEFARWVQFESDDCLDYSSREHGKSTWRHTRITQEVVRDPNITIGIFSFDLKQAQKHLVRWKIEMEQNAVIRSAWDDVFYWDPREEGAFWSVEKGCSVKRQVRSIMPTVSAWTFMAGLPTGSRFGILYPDDCETEKTVESDEQRDKMVERFRGMIDLGGRGAIVWPVGTFHHPSGLLAQLIKAGWPAHCFTAEDPETEAPDIAAIYDELGGVRPDNGVKIPEVVREIRLRGMPRYLHPMECAITRWKEGTARYEMQRMGDPLAGQTMRFRMEWVAEELRINADLREWGRGKYGYLLSDPSKGLHDNSVGMLLVTDADNTIVLVDAFRAKLSPAEWAREMYLMCVSWQRVVDMRQIRVEVYGQATWDHNLRTYFEKENYAGPPIYGLGSHLGARSNQALIRAWTRLEPLFRTAKLRLPLRLPVVDENQRLYDFVQYFLDHEYEPFPMPKTDDILSCLALLGEPQEKVPPLEYPEREVPWRKDYAWEDEMPENEAPGIDPESWLWQ